MRGYQADDSPGQRRTDLPTFDLCCRFDDPVAPEKVTVFPSDHRGEQTTVWLSADVADTIGLEAVR